jgi:hypothetical protein
MTFREFKLNSTPRMIYERLGSDMEVECNEAASSTKHDTNPTVSSRSNLHQVDFTHT